MCTPFARDGYTSDLSPPDQGHNQYLLHWMKMTCNLPLTLFQLHPAVYDPSHRDQLPGEGSCFLVVKKPKC